jgi:hypothetical protein
MEKGTDECESEIHRPENRYEKRKISQGRAVIHHRLIQETLFEKHIDGKERKEQKNPVHDAVYFFFPREQNNPGKSEGDSDHHNYGHTEQDRCEYGVFERVFSQHGHTRRQEEEKKNNKIPPCPFFPPEKYHDLEVKKNGHRHQSGDDTQNCRDNDGDIILRNIPKIYRQKSFFPDEGKECICNDDHDREDKNITQTFDRTMKGLDGRKGLNKQIRKEKTGSNENSAEIPYIEEWDIDILPQNIEDEDDSQ